MSYSSHPRFLEHKNSSAIPNIPVFDTPLTTDYFVRDLLTADLTQTAQRCKLFKEISDTEEQDSTVGHDGTPLRNLHDIDPVEYLDSNKISLPAVIDDVHGRYVIRPTLQSRLLDLPAELKNDIYRYALLESNLIEIPAFGSAALEPALLRSCHEIRDDAYAIYFEENTFTFEIVDFDASRYARFCHLHLHIVPRIVAVLPQAGCWPNLKAWLKLYFEGMGGSIIRYSVDDCRMLYNAARMFEAVNDLGFDVESPRPSWHVVAKLLENMRKSLVYNEPRWKVAGE